MSRRKQARPRHVDDPDLESPAISTNSVVPAFPEGEDSTDHTQTKSEEDPKDFTGDFQEESETEAPGVIESHVCSNCQAEFLTFDEFLTHKDQCSKPVVLLFDENQTESPENQSRPCDFNGLSMNNSQQASSRENFDTMSTDAGSDGEHGFEKLPVPEDEVDAGVRVEPDNGENQSDFENMDNMEDDYEKLVEEEENESELDESIKEGELGEKIKSDTDADIPPYMQPLSGLLPANSNSNVLLEPLEATKAAVAQFAENNLPEEERDVTRLHSALFNLQQQQIMQLQLIHQLQQQLVSGGGTPNGQLPAALLNGQLGPNFPGLHLGIPGLAHGSQQGHKSLDGRKSTGSDSPSPKPLNLLSKNRERETSSERPSPASLAGSPAAAAVEASAKSLDLTSAASSLSTVSSPVFKAGSTSTPSRTPSTPALDYSMSSTKNNGSTESPASGGFLAGGDDPFFKHKCRLCHKVFGSDSALQIHVRSHTDPPPHHAFFVDVPSRLGAMLSTTDAWTCEKPFQCNICGGRFSTRGNLKVHFQRHKLEFPNVEMNPNPVPEHLDKSPIPLLGSPFPSAALTPFANPAFMGMQGLMNGFMFPPPHLAPRPPMAAHMMPKPPSLQHDDRRRSSSPNRGSNSRHHEIKKEFSPGKPGSEAPHRPSPDMKDSAKFLPTMSTPPSVSISAHLSKASPILPMSSIPLISNYPVMSPLPSRPPFSQHSRPPTMPPPPAISSHSVGGGGGGDQFNSNILPASIMDNDENLEQFMEISKSETSKLQQLVDNIEHKLTDPNQCVICHRVLSCKSALQMHYRIHTGERPFKCKICGRSFTTKGNLKTHMGVHRAKPPLRMMHQCPVCHKQFTNLLVLQQHIRSHTGMSSLPAMPTFGGHMYGRHDMEPMHHGGGPVAVPGGMKRPYMEDFDKELDLSKKPRVKENDGELDVVKMEQPDDMPEGSHEGLDGVNDDDMGDDEDEEQNDMDDEANKLAAKDAKKEGLNMHNHEGIEERSTPDDSIDGLDHKYLDKDGRPQSSQSEDGLGYSRAIPRSSSPKYLQEDSNTSQDSSFNAYSTSLAALEERVRAIDSSMARNPLSQFHAAPFLLAPNYPNSDRNLSPRSESGSDGEKDTVKPSTPALSVSSEGSMGSNFMIGAMDSRPQDLNGSTTTTCNICYKTFACRSALDIHYRSHTKERPYKCDQCDRSFTTRGNMKQHLLTHKSDDGSDTPALENNNNNSCTPNQNDNENSNDSSHFNDSLRENVRTDLNESQGSTKKDTVSPNSTEKSEKSTTSSSSSSSHHVSQSASSTTSSSTPSRHSNTSYTSPDSNQSPFISKTPTVKHQCLVCQKGFSSASALQIHIRTHTGDKPFKCSVCGKAFTTKGNLKVHMGTHMWNNSPSRRGRRMSIEPPFMLAHKDNPYLPHGFPPRPDFYPFQFPPFMNGLPAPPKSLSEMSVLQGMTNGMGIKPEMTSPRSGDHNRVKADSSPVHEEKPKFAESGELDLSMKSTGSTGSRSSEKTSPSSVDSNSSSGMVSPPHTSLGWGWKASCHMCSRTFPTPAALEHHVRSIHIMGDSLPKVAAT